MNSQPAHEALEIERKYGVGISAVMPTDVLFAAQGLLIHSRDEYELRANYFDTPSGDLGKQRIAVRRREGGSDTGWHLKTKQGDVSRERQWPLSDQLPDGLKSELVALVGEEGVAQLVPIAELHTFRRVTRLTGNGSDEHAAGQQDGDAASQQWIIEFADDTVSARNELTGVTQQWREWEAELAPHADQAWLDRVEPLLVAAGGTREHGTSKLQRIMGRQPRVTDTVSDGA